MWAGEVQVTCFHVTGPISGGAEVWGCRAALHQVGQSTATREVSVHKCAQGCTRVQAAAE